MHTAWHAQSGYDDGHSGHDHGGSGLPPKFEDGSGGSSSGSTTVVVFPGLEKCGDAAGQAQLKLLMSTAAQVNAMYLKVSTEATSAKAKHGRIIMQMNKFKQMMARYSSGKLLTKIQFHKNNYIGNHGHDHAGSEGHDHGTGQSGSFAAC